MLIDLTQPTNWMLKKYDDNAVKSEYAEAGEWLAGEVWQDADELCQLCLENRARLVMMYHHEYNS